MIPSYPLGRRTIATLVLLILIAGAGLWLLAEGDRANAQGGIAVESCTVITEPGRYELAGGVEGGEGSTCIEIRSGNVVLDGRDHSVEGDGSFGSAGVVVRSPSDRPVENVTVRDLTVSDWDDGIRLVGVEGGVVTGATSRDNRVGVSLLDAHGVRILDSEASGNRLRGISLLENATNNTLANNTATDNDLFGIHLADAGVRNNTVTANDASSNEFGIVLVSARDNAILDNEATSNRIAGVWLTAARDNRIDGNVVSNRFYGVYLADRSNGNTVSNNTATGNPVGIRLRSSDRNVVADNEIRSSEDNAVLLIASDHNTVVRNVGSDNGRGVTVLRSASNTVEDNRLGG